MHGACGRSYCALILYLAFISCPQGPHNYSLPRLKHEAERTVVVLKPGFLSPQAGCEFFRSPGKLLCCWPNHREGKLLLQSTWELSEEAGSHWSCLRPKASQLNNTYSLILICKEAPEKSSALGLTSCFQGPIVSHVIE